MASARGSSPTAERESPRRRYLESVRGEIALNYFGHTRSSRRQDRNFFLDGDLQLSLEGAFGKSIQYVLKPRARADNASRTSAEVEFLEDGTARPALTAQEAYVAWYGDVYEVSLGKQIFTWGVGDGLRPTDNLNPMDVLDVPTAEKIGVPALSLFRHGGLVDVQAVFVPLFTPGRLPRDDNDRWAVPNTSGIERVARAFGMRPVVVEDGLDLPARDLSNAQYALRISSSQLITGWDLALSYYRGHYSIGVLEGRVVPPRLVSGALAPPEVIVQSVYPKMQRLGGSVSTTFGDWEAHAEGALHLTDDRDMDDNYWQYVTGLNYTLHEPLGGTMQEIVLTVEYAGESVVRSRRANSRFAAAGFGRGLTNSLIGRLVFKLTDDTRFEVSGAHNLNDHDFAVQSMLTHKVVGGFTVKAGYDLFEGPADSFFGRWDENDRFFLTLSYEF